MLGVGIDWAEDSNQVALGRPGDGVIEEFSLPHRPEAVGRLVERIAALEPDPAEVRVAIETKHGDLVEALVEAGYAVVPVNPDLVARRRGPARKKDDGEDARILCLLALDRHTVLRPLIPHEQFSTPNSLQCYGGKAPVTRRSGKSEFVVSCRLACNRHLANAVQQWAFCSLKRSGWAREFYDAQRARGKTHHAALRALGNRWLEVLWHCLRKGVLYDETTHVANRERALKPLAA